MVKLDFEKSDINNKDKEIKKLRLKNYSKNRILSIKKISPKDILKYKGSCIWVGNLDDIREDR